ncbi:MAG: NTP transferase domain-containing protein [Nannocystaceae bacterium]|nr:NTP transferase domain-containing protein [Nannocystaceae bacterium]
MATDAPIAAVVLAAGKGTRMGSSRAKVLHELLGRALIVYPLEVARRLGACRTVVVVGHQKDDVIDAVRSAFPDARDSIGFVEQAEQLGTGHAVLCALPGLVGFDGPVLILSGDVPLVSESSLRALIDGCRDSGSGLAAATFRPADPTGYGRMLRDADGKLVDIREQRDASADERAIGECNAGIYCVLAEHLRRDLPRIGRSNTQNEVYLTELVQLGVQRGSVAAVELPVREATGINTQAQLVALGEEMANSRG